MKLSLRGYVLTRFMGQSSREGLMLQPETKGEEPSWYRRVVRDVIIYVTQIPTEMVRPQYNSEIA